MTEEQQSQPDHEAPVGGDPQDDDKGAAETPHTSPKEDKADQESEQSFPASDPPANY
ncbi:hypothetical protein IEQ44_11155 [Nocardioides sp. Y6]|uniref:Uncharacterized protein n=1 Tax=Nocardioides malaquae TaxID=2773426 RepID=A0ABR9RUI1_9ACTN|nr:hypothetical protein [Nocardioides malaquae]MBE7325212.1 hypothetical protein [Nocardioides malaquae]